MEDNKSPKTAVPGEPETKREKNDETERASSGKENSSDVLGLDQKKKKKRKLKSIVGKILRDENNEVGFYKSMSYLLSRGPKRLKFQRRE